MWGSLIALFIYGDYFELYVPGKVESLLNVTGMLDSPIDLLLAAVLLSAPALMIALTFILGANAARTLTLAVASFLLVVVTLVGVTSVSAWHTFYVMYAFLEVCVLLSIATLAWRWPRVT